MEVTTLTETLDKLALAHKENDQVSVGAMLEATGRRSFGPLLLVPGLIVLSPISGVPGVPTLTGAMVFLISIQLLVGRRHFWLPSWVLNRCVSYAHFEKALGFLRPIARFVDRLLRPRLTWLTESVSVYVVATVCAAIAIAMPPLELLPFAATAAGAAITAFGLALIGHDGLVALIALAFCVVCVGIVGMAFL